MGKEKKGDCNTVENQKRAKNVAKKMKEAEDKQDDAINDSLQGRNANASVICPCPEGEGQPGVIGLHMWCSEDENGLDGGDVRYLAFSFRRPGDYRYHHFVIPIIPKDCKKKGELGDGGKEVAYKVSKAIMDASLRGVAGGGWGEDEIVPEGEINPAAQGGIDIGYRFVPGKYDAVIIKFDKVCCLNAGSDVGKNAAYVLTFPWKRKPKKKGGKKPGKIRVTKAPFDKSKKKSKKHGLKSKYGKFQYPDEYDKEKWEWIGSPLAFSSRRGGRIRTAAIVFVSGTPDELDPSDFRGPGIGPNGRRGLLQENREAIGARWMAPVVTIPFPVVDDSPERQAEAIGLALRRSGMVSKVDIVGDSLTFEMRTMYGARFSGYGVNFGGGCNALAAEFPWEISLQQETPRGRRALQSITEALPASSPASDKHVHIAAPFLRHEESELSNLGLSSGTLPATAEPPWLKLPDRNHNRVRTREVSSVAENSMSL